VGTESADEYLEAEFSLPVPASELMQRLPPHLPAGVRLLDALTVAPGSPRLSDFDMASTYLLWPVPPATLPGELTPERAAARLAEFTAAPQVRMPLLRESQVSEVDLRPIVRNFGVNEDGIFITIIQGTGKGVRPLEAAAHLLSVALAPERFAPVKISAELLPRRG